MAAKDLLHESFKRALLRDKWTITHDPLVLKIGRRNALVALGAQKLLAAERGPDKIAVEIKTFAGPSPMSELEKAWGQFFLYAKVLRKRNPERSLYLAVSETIFETLFEEEAGQLLLTEPGFRIIIFDEKLEEITQWHPPINP
ncbi:MAG: element excision factor XisH family protein [Cyanobacteria bacterium P01_F01_bin.150]